MSLSVGGGGGGDESSECTQRPLGGRADLRLLFIKVSLEAVRNQKCDVSEASVCVCVVCVYWCDD